MTGAEMRAFVLHLVAEGVNDEGIISDELDIDLETVRTVIADLVLDGLLEYGAYGELVRSE